MVGVQLKPAGLIHEYDTYLELRREIPKVGAVTEDGVEVTLEDLVEKRAD